jgi:hypothetical protein
MGTINNMKTRPILFSTLMVQAILQDRKTVTRRTKGLESKNEYPDAWHRTGDPQKYTHKWGKNKHPKEFNPLKIEYGFKHIEWIEGDDLAYAGCPYGMPGDLLWVRETWLKNEGEYPTDLGYVYKAELGKNEIDYSKELKVKWKQSIHMPKEAARIWLKITSIKVERLNEITNEESIKEGIEPISNSVITPTHYRNYLRPTFIMITPKWSFKSLWDSINGVDSWHENPWVWAISFEVVSKTGMPCN